MGSAANPTAWSPYDSYKDCSQGICSIYCPQWCYIIFPPPPPLEAQDDGDSGTNFSPLIIAVIGILGSAFLLVSYYIIISKYCKRRTNSDHQSSINELEVNQNQISHDQQQQQQEVVLNGLDESLIKSIAVCKYKKVDGLIEGTDCAVCLSEFQENENLRLLPKCSHAFHLPCIDTWLRSHSNCPLCRSNVVSILNLLPVQTSSSTTVNVSNLEMRRQSDLVLVIDDRDSRVNQEQVFDHVIGNSEERASSVINQENEQEGVHEMRSRESNFPCQGNLLIADILNISDDELDLCEECCESQMGNSSVSTKTSNSRHDHKGKNLIGSSQLKN